MPDRSIRDIIAFGCRRPQPQISAPAPDQPPLRLMISEILKRFPNWIFLLVCGAIFVLLGSATEVKIAGNSLRISPTLNVAVISAGALLIVVALWQSRKSGEADEMAVTKVEVSSIDMDRTDKSLRTRVSGRIEPAVQGVRVWIAREHVAHSTGRFHLGHKPALTDKNGEWEQTTYLWPQGTFRIHAIVGGRAAESLFMYYRRAYDHARSVYKAKVDPNSDDFPGWPFLEELPSGCVSDFKTVTV